MKARHDIRNWTPTIYEPQCETGRGIFIVSGRDRWALEQLMQAGRKGCTPTGKLTRWKLDTLGVFNEEPAR